MATDLFKKLSKFSSNLDKFNTEANKLKKGGGGFKKDDRYWSLPIDKEGNGSATIRFIPDPSDLDAAPLTKLISYSFKGPTGAYYIENSPHTLIDTKWDKKEENGFPDPMAEWKKATLARAAAEDDAELKKQADSCRRNTFYIANILVVKCKARPEDEGKVFLFKFGKKIFDKIFSKMNAEDEDDRANPFDLVEGVNFRLNVYKNDGGFPDYSNSMFETDRKPVADTDEKVEAIWKAGYSIEAETSPDKIKSYDELLKRRNTVLGLVAGMAVEEAPKRSAETKTMPWENQSEPEDKPKAAKVTNVVQDEEEDDDPSEFFSKLANRRSN